MFKRYVKCKNKDEKAVLFADFKTLKNEATQLTRQGKKIIMRIISPSTSLVPSVFTFFLKDHTLDPNPLRWPTIGRTHFSYYEQRRGLRVRENYTFYKQPETGSPQKVASTFSEF